MRSTASSVLNFSPAVARRTTLFGEQYAHNIADVDAPTRSLEHRWIIDGWMKLIVPHAPNTHIATTELYDLQNDPTEEKNLAGANAEKVKTLTAKVDAWWKP